MAEFTPDRFDDLPDALGRVGAHRAPAPRGRGWVIAAWAALASGVLIVAGLYYLSLISDRVTFELPGISTSAPEPVPVPSVDDGEPLTPSVEPITDPALAALPEGFTITVLNGTEVDGLGSAARDLIVALGWPVGTVTAAAQTDLPATSIYYRDPALEGVAAGMGVLLGVGATEFSESFPGAAITIALGADFAAVANP